MKFGKFKEFVKLSDKEINFLNFYSFHNYFFIFAPLVTLLTFLVRRAVRMNLMNIKTVRTILKFVGVLLFAMFLLLLGDVIALAHVRLIISFFSGSVVSFYHFFNLTSLIISICCVVQLATMRAPNE
jgi:hypothetical protein